MEEQLVTSQQEQGHGSGTIPLEGRLSSFISQKGLQEGPCWVLVFDRSTNSFAFVEGIHIDWIFARTDEFHLVAVGSAEDEVVELLSQYRAKDLLSVIRGLPIYRLVGSSEVRLSPYAKVPRYVELLSEDLMKRALDDSRIRLVAERTAAFIEQQVDAAAPATDGVRRSGRGPSLVRQLSAPVSAAMGNRWEAAHYGFASATMVLRSFFLGNTLPEQDRRRRNGDLVVHPALIEFLNRRLRRGYDLETGGAGPSEEEVAKMLKDIICQALAAFLPACATAYPVLKDAPNHVKLIISGGLLIIFIVLYAGMLSRSLARRQLAFRLACCSVVTLLTFSLASQLSGPTYIAIAAVVGVLLNLFTMLLPF